MKRISLFALLMLLIAAAAYSQKVVEKPKTGFSTAPFVSITKVELSDTATILHFLTKYKAGDSIIIPETAFIRPVGGGKKLLIKRAEGIPLGKSFAMPPSGEVCYRLTFPPLGKTVAKIDYVESEDERSWAIYDIQLKPLKHKLVLPQELQGNWFNREIGDWVISFLDTVAVYKSQLWRIDGASLKQHQGVVTLKNGAKTVRLLVKDGEEGTFMLGESPKSMVACCSSIENSGRRKPANDKPYELPILKADSATYSGYIRGYTPRTGIKTFTISVDDILAGKGMMTGGSKIVTVKIDNSGYFSVKLPVYYPIQAYVESSLFFDRVYLEPGKDLFQMFDSIDGEKTSLLMGESARVSSDLERLRKIETDVYSINYYRLRRDILDLKAERYKARLLDMKRGYFAALDSVMKVDAICARAYQVKKEDIEYSYLATIMRYQSDYDVAYHEKHGIPYTQRISLRSDSLTVEFYSDVITNEYVNNPFALLSSHYGSYIYSMRNLEMLRDTSNFSLTTLGLADELEKTGYSYTTPERVMVEKLRELEQLRNSPELKVFDEKYENQKREFFKKHEAILKPLVEKNPSYDISMVESDLIKNNVPLTDEDKQLLAALKEHHQALQPVIAKEKLFYQTYDDSVGKFFENHDGFFRNLFHQRQMATLIPQLKSVFGVQPGLATDIFAVQDYYPEIVEKMSPVCDGELKIMQQQITTPFIAEYLARCNQQTKDKIAANSKQVVPLVSAAPKTEPDKLFDSIMQKYRGKVVYVDFWATWCGPCRAGIEEVKPLKEELAGKDLVFVYITNESSPQNTYSNMIPKIKGEHYRLSKDEWNYLGGKFNISDIPHYVLVGKDGRIINPDLGQLPVEVLKAELERYLRE